MTASPGEVTLLLEQVRRGNKEAEAELAPLIYQDLRRIAGCYMRNERPGHTLEATAVVNEVYLRLVDQSRVDWKSRAHFFGVAAQLMRRFLLDYARERTAAKRGGHRVPMEIENFEMASVAQRPEEVLAVDEALTRLERFDRQQGRIVEMRCFGGLTVEETAHALGISPRTVKREWAMATAWLRAELADR
jgi:RNA polymerase sigma factor (TIGR02999 family)